LRLSWVERFAVVQRQLLVGLFTYAAFVCFLVLIAIEGPDRDNNLGAIVYIVAVYVAFCRISMFSLKIDCFRLRSKQSVLQLQSQWCFAAAGWLVVAVLVTSEWAPSVASVFSPYKY
jgi:hypothetical protein